MLPLICFLQLFLVKELLMHWALSSQSPAGYSQCCISVDQLQVMAGGCLIRQLPRIEQYRQHLTELLQIVFSTYIVLTELYFIFFYILYYFYSVTFKPHCISPEREQWIFLCVENRRGLRSFSISTNPLLNCLPWCVCYHRKRLQHFVYLTSFNIKAQLKCCIESWISLLRRLWALTHINICTHLLTHTHTGIHNNMFLYKTMPHFIWPCMRLTVDITCSYTILIIKIKCVIYFQYI